MGSKGGRKGLTIFLFLMPTLLGLLVFNVYPILLNTYMSFTDRNKTRTQPACEAVASKVLDPLCWPVFEQNTRARGRPYEIQQPLFENYRFMLGQFFSGPALLSLLQIGIIFVPLVAANVVNRRLDQNLDRPISSTAVWVIAIAAVALLAFVIGLREAYDQLMRTGPFIVMVFKTILFVAIRVPLTFVFGLALALILNSNLPGRNLFRILLFVPWGASSVAILVALIWRFLFYEAGPINQVLGLMGIVGPKWLQSPTLAFGVIVLADIWFSYPFFMVTILGALQSIPQELYEAADVDGASWWTKLTRITLPLIRPAVLPAAVLTSITAFQMFGTAYGITQGGPLTGANTPGATEFVMVYAYNQIYNYAQWGRATAFAVMIFLMLFAATLFSLRVTRITKGAYES